VEIWRTAPYLHDGRAATLKEMLTTFNENGVHGDTASLNANELDELIEYVLSL
jgi:cytochrome c peroxidase